MLGTFQKDRLLYRNKIILVQPQKWGKYPSKEQNSKPSKLLVTSFKFDKYYKNDH